jgi:hypothetical protein
MNQVGASTATYTYFGALRIKKVQGSKRQVLAAVRFVAHAESLDSSFHNPTSVTTPDANKTAPARKKMTRVAIGT